ncbi:MAG TPA: CDP-diacylglycerol--glycerol-3-phosphate 3-phosphatidyltransferase [Jatrophihabitans sp.]|nr:CDP-diacylglycerol--glycerol-3-phosphate 3-phosphatidyltransferase [Jatrophihabitans sp.]
MSGADPRFGRPAAEGTARPPGAPVDGAPRPGMSRAAERAAEIAPTLSHSLSTGLAGEPDHIGDPITTVSVWNLANALTVLRLVLVPFFALALFHEHGHSGRWRLIATAVFVVASLTDRLDGELARRRGLITEFGKLADPIADKALIGMALFGLSALAELPWWVTIVVLVREVGVTLLRFWVIRRGVIPASRGGKLKTMTQAVAIGLFLLPLHGGWHDLAWVVMILAVVLTLATGIDYIFRAVRLRRDSAQAAL